MMFWPPSPRFSVVRHRAGRPRGRIRVLLPSAVARSAAIVFYGSGVAVHVASVVLAGAGILSILVPVALAAAVIWFLFQPAVKATFTRTV